MASFIAYAECVVLYSHILHRYRFNLHTRRRREAGIEARSRVIRRQQRCVRLHCRKVEWEAAISLQTNCISVHRRLRPAWSLGDGNHVSQAGLWMEDEFDASHPYFTAAPRSNPTCRLFFPPLWWKFERSFSQTYCQLLHPRYRCFLTVASGVSGAHNGCSCTARGFKAMPCFQCKICIQHYSGRRLFLPAALWGKRWADPCPGGQIPALVCVYGNGITHIWTSTAPLKG